MRFVAQPEVSKFAYIMISVNSVRSLTSEMRIASALASGSRHRLVKINSWVPMFLKYIDIEIYVLKTTLNASGTVQTTRQGQNHAELH
jgi:hypothetical protein